MNAEKKINQVTAKEKWQSYLRHPMALVQFLLVHLAALITAAVVLFLIAYVLFFTDPGCNDPVQEQNLLQIERLCDMHNVPFATNLATAEMLTLGLARGDLDWREGSGKAAPLYEF